MSRFPPAGWQIASGLSSIEYSGELLGWKSWSLFTPEEETAVRSEEAKGRL
jgi:hypothetical protein